MTRVVAANDFTSPPSHEQAIREVAQANNSVRFFMEESPVVQLTENIKDRISETKLYKEYWSFCMGPGGARPVASRAFRAMMRELQSQLNFKLVLARTELGAQEGFYTSITLAEKRAKSA